MTNSNNNQYTKILKSIKNEIINSHYKALISVNRELILMYWNIGKIILQQSQWGNKFIDKLSIDLSIEFKNQKGFSTRNLKYMRKLAEVYPDIEFVQQLVAQIPWGHNIILLDKIKNADERLWYINQTIENAWSRNILSMQIDSKLYKRQVTTKKLNNFNSTLPSIQSDLAIQAMKDPYIFNFISLNGKLKEIEIEQAMINKIKSVLLELGNGFAFVASQYKLTVENKDYFIDLLFYHLNLKCYIVVELKAREFEPQDAGQLNFYLSAIDKLKKDKNDNSTIGLLLCRSKDTFTVEYALQDITKPIGVSEYKLLEDIPEYLQSQLPKSEDIKFHINNIEN